MTRPGRRPYEEFGSWLRSRRLARRWTQEDLARLLDYDVTYIRKIEWGERRPSDPLRVRLAQVLELPLSGLPSAAPVIRPRFPTPSTPLIGRTREAEKIVALVQDGSRLVTVLGPPGMGKTRLAIEVASRFDADAPGRAHFVALLGVTAPDGVVGAIADALEIARPAGACAVDQLVDALVGQETVLVLDNFEHVMPAASLIAELLGAVPTLTVLVTSREALSLAAETQYWLPALAVPDRAETATPAELADVPSVALFVARARAVSPDFELTDDNATAVAEICARLEGVPLAIELAAATSRVFPPRVLLAHLGHGLDLPVNGPRDAPAHHRTLRAAIAWSYDLLCPSSRRLFVRLAAFSGGCTIDAAVAVCRGADRTDVDPAEGVLTLAAKSLLDPVPEAPGGPRFVPLESVREFAYEELDRSGELEAVQRRHAEFFVETAERIEPFLTGADQAEWLRVLDTEHANLRAALRWGLEHDRLLATRLAAALWRFWWIRGHLAEGSQWLEAVLQQRQGTRAEVRALSGLGVLARTQGAYQPAEAWLGQASTLASSIGDEEGLGLALLNLAIIAENRVEYGRAAQLFERSREVYAAIGDVRGEGHALNGLALVQLAEGNVDGAGEAFTRSLALFRELNEPWSIAMVSTNLGWVAYKQGNRALAQTLYEQNLGVYRILGDERAVANMLSNLGLVVLDERNVSRATGLFEEALLIYGRLGDRRGVAECLEHLAIAASDTGDAQQVAALLGAADRVRETIGAPLAPAERRALDEVVNTARSQLGADGFPPAWREGREASTSEVITRVFCRSRPSRGSRETRDPRRSPPRV